MSIYFIYEIWNPPYIVPDLLVFFCFHFILLFLFLSGFLVSFFFSRFLPLPVSYDTIISSLQGAEKDIKYQDN